MAGAEYDPASNRANIQFEVTPGVRAKVEVDGAHLWGRTKRKLLPIYQIAGLDPELIQESRENLISIFRRRVISTWRCSPMCSPRRTEDPFFFA